MCLCQQKERLVLKHMYYYILTLPNTQFSEMSGAAI